MKHFVDSNLSEQHRTNDKLPRVIDKQILSAYGNNQRKHSNAINAQPPLIPSYLFLTTPTQSKLHPAFDAPPALPQSNTSLASTLRSTAPRHSSPSPPLPPSIPLLLRLVVLIIILARPRGPVRRIPDIGPLPLPPGDVGSPTGAEPVLFFRGGRREVRV